MVRKLPLDLSTFSEIRNSNYLYIDKTEYAYRMITSGRRYFLSRPRRFGKSLFISTLKEILTNNKPLFKDLWIDHSDYAWHMHGVIVFDFSLLGITNADTVEKGLCHVLNQIIELHDLPVAQDSAHAVIMFAHVVSALRKKYGRVALLIDEYDSPMLHALKDVDRAEEIRDALARFFSAIKGLDAVIDFVFITGVSSFAKAGIFSGINNVLMITLDDAYAGVCGYTEKEIEHYFTPYMDQWIQKEQISADELRQKIKEWYNGYRFSQSYVTVYNPFSLSHAMATSAFKNYWFQSGAPTFLINVLKKEYRTFDPSNLELSEDALGIFDVGATPLASLMFQTGYLTIVDYNRERQLFKLDYPNYEVKFALQKYLFEVFAHLDYALADTLSQQLYNALHSRNLEQVVFLLKQLFAHVPYQLHMREEKFYHALLQMIFITAGLRSQSEYSTSHGRIDIMLDLPNTVYVIEIKFNGSVHDALKQIEQRRYYEPFIKYGKKIILLGLSFIRSPSHFDILYASDIDVV